MYLVLSALTYSPISLVAATKASAFYFTVCMLPPSIYPAVFSILLTGHIPVQNVCSYLLSGSSDNLIGSPNFIAFCTNSKFITVFHNIPQIFHLPEPRDSLKVHFNIIHPSARRSSVPPLSWRVSEQNSVCITLLSHAYRAPDPSHSRWLISQIICGVEMVCPMNVGSSDTYKP